MLSSHSTKMRRMGSFRFSTSHNHGEKKGSTMVVTITDLVSRHLQQSFIKEVLLHQVSQLIVKDSEDPRIIGGGVSPESNL